MPEAIETIAVSQGVSFPLPLLKAAKLKAAAERRSLSSYIQNLVDRDLNETGQIAVNFATAKTAPEKPEGGK